MFMRGTDSIFKCNSGCYAPSSSSSTRCCYRKDGRAKPGEPLKINALSEVGERSIEKELNTSGP